MASVQKQIEFAEKTSADELTEAVVAKAESFVARKVHHRRGARTVPTVSDLVEAGIDELQSEQEKITQRPFIGQ